MRVVWEPEKARTNFLKHGVRFSDAEGVLFDPNALTREDCSARSEYRHVSVGMDHVGKVLVVVYTIRGSDVRIISARRATRKERQQYAEGIRF
jgi:uncharacterized protein